MTANDISDKIKKSDRTIRRWIDKVKADPALCESLGIDKDAAFTMTDTLPESLSTYLLTGKVADKRPEQPKNGFSKPHVNPEIPPIYPEMFVSKLDTSKIPDDMQPKLSGKLDKMMSQIDREVVKQMTPPPVVTKKSLSDKVLHGDILPVISIVILILADCVSFGWIAYLSFDKFAPAVIFFSASGFAVAYSAIKNAVGFKGYEQNGWLVGFAIVQFLLHMAAMQMFGEWSLQVGKFVISLAIPLAAAGIALTYKKSNKN